MGTHFSCYQLKTDCYRYVVVCKPYGNHKAKTYSKCARTHTHTHTHMRERNISVSLKKMSSNYKGEVREKEGNRETQQLENNFY